VRAAGFSLIEALVAILLFSLGILAVIGLQARSVADVGESRVRAQAAQLGAQLVARMRTDGQPPIDHALNAGSASGCAGGSSSSSNPAVSEWLVQVHSALPGASGLRQQVLVDAATGRVTVNLCWKSPAEARPHNFMLRTQLP